MAEEATPVPESSQRAWTNDDTVALLRGAAEFRARTGSAPTGSTMPAFFASVSASLPPQITKDKLYNKLRHLRHKHSQGGAAPHDILVHRLCSDLWGPTDGKNPSGAAPKEEDADAVAEDHTREEEDGGDVVDTAAYPCVMDAVAEYCKIVGLSSLPLEDRMKLGDSSRMAALEQKWRRHWHASMKLKAKQLGLTRELLEMLMAG